MTGEDRQPSSEPQGKTRSRRLIFGGIMGAFGVGVVVAIYLVIRLLQAPAQGVVTTKPSSSPSASQAISYKQLKGQTFTLEYPSSLVPTKLAPTSSYGDLDNVVLGSASLTAADHLAIAVQKGFSGLINNSAYRYRQLHPELYTETKRQLGSDAVSVMTKTQDGYEQVAFIPHKDLIATLAFTSNQVSPVAQGQLMDRVIASFHWNAP